MYRLGSAVVVAVMLFAGVALAALAPNIIPSGPKTHTRTLNIKGVGAPDPGDADASGACNVDPWVDQCSGTNCTCLSLAVSKASGSMDKGHQTVGTVYITVDQDVNPATESAVGNGPNPGCSPFLGILTDTVASTGETKTLNLFGVSCKKVIAVSKNNPSGKHVGDTIVGGWGISGDNPPSPDASGWGTLSGTEINNGGAVSLKLKGLVTE